MYRIIPLFLAACTAPTDPMLPPPAPAVPAESVPTWSWADLGQGIGTRGFAILEGWGRPKLVTSTHHGYGWAVMGVDREGEFRSVHNSRRAVDFDDRVSAIATGSLYGDDGDEILVVRESGIAELYAGWDRHLVSTFDTGYDRSAKVRGLEIVDVTGDGAAEIIMTKVAHFTERDLVVYDASATELFRLADAGGIGLVVDQLDDDPGLEIATSAGTVVDVDTWTVQWQHSAEFGNTLTSADVDGDGIAELVAGDARSDVNAWHVTTQSLLWSIDIFDIDLVHTADMDGDGTEELLIGEGQWGGVLGYDLSTQTEIKSLPRDTHGTGALTTADLDGDGTLEVYSTGGASSGGADALYRHDWETEAITWENADLDAPYRGPVLGDLDGDGRRELVVIADESESGYGGARMLVFDARSKRLELLSQPLMDDRNWEGVSKPILADVDGDGSDEIFVVGTEVRTGRIERYHLEAGALVLDWFDSTQGDPEYRHGVITDLYGDGLLDIVVSSEDDVRAFGVDGTMTWAGHPLDNAWKLTADDVDGDGIEEVVVIAFNGDAYIFDTLTTTLDAQLTGPWTDLAVFPQPIGQPRALMLSTDTELVTYLYDGSDYLEHDRFVVPDALEVEAISTPTRRTVAVAHDGVSSIFTLPDYTRVWQSMPLHGELGHDVVYLPTTGELLMTSDHGVYAFRP